MISIVCKFADGSNRTTNPYIGLAYLDNEIIFDNKVKRVISYKEKARTYALDAGAKAVEVWKGTEDCIKKYFN